MPLQMLQQSDPLPQTQPDVAQPLPETQPIPEPLPKSPTTSKPEEIPEPTPDVLPKMEPDVMQPLPDSTSTPLPLQQPE